MGYFAAVNTFFGSDCLGALNYMLILLHYCTDAENSGRFENFLPFWLKIKKWPKNRELYNLLHLEISPAIGEGFLAHTLETRLRLINC